MRKSGFIAAFWLKIILHSWMDALYIKWATHLYLLIEQFRRHGFSYPHEGYEQLSVSHTSFGNNLPNGSQLLCKLTDRCIVSSARCFVTESVALGHYISKLIFRIYLSNLWTENLSLFSPVLLNLCGVVCRALPVLYTLYFTILLSALRSICLVKGMYLSSALQVRACAEMSALLGLWEGFFLLGEAVIFATTLVPTKHLGYTLVGWLFCWKEKKDLSTSLSRHWCWILSHATGLASLKYF